VARPKNRELIREPHDPKAIRGHIRHGRRRTAHAFALPTTDGGVGRVSGVVRPPLQRTICHAQLSDQIRAVQAASQGTYRARSVHADLTPGVGLLGGRHQVDTLMVGAVIESDASALVSSLGFPFDEVADLREWPFIIEATRSAHHDIGDAPFLGCGRPRRCPQAVSGTSGLRSITTASRTLSVLPVSVREHQTR
jgi:hypothetical protein